MHINRVTITGADDSTNIDWIREISGDYPMVVEWGILVSQSQIGKPRFPSMEWIDNLRRRSDGLDLSMHVCGRWVREICAGNWKPFLSYMESNLFCYRRVQLNFHGYQHLLNRSFYRAARHISEKHDIQFIFQLDGVNDALIGEARIHQVEAVPLFDLSGGAGVVPGSWPLQQLDTYCGYAGGLGPDNVLTELERIEKVATGWIWIDMETKVRTPDNQALDRDAVESVLRQVSDR